MRIEINKELLMTNLRVAETKKNKKSNCGLIVPLRLWILFLAYH